MASSSSVQGESAVSVIMFILLGAVGMAGFYFSLPAPDKSLMSTGALGSNDPQLVDQLATSADILRMAEELPPYQQALTGNVHDASLAADRLLSQNPHDLVTIICAAKVFYKAGATTDSFKQMERALQLAPSNKFLRREYAANLASREQMNSAIQQYRLIVAKWPQWPEARIELAQLLFNRKQYLDAAKELQVIIDAGADHKGYAQKMRGIALARAGHAKEGVSDFVLGSVKNSQGNFPEDVERTVNSFGGVEKAVAELKKMSEANPSDAIARLKLGEILLYSNDAPAAKDILLEARKLAPQDPNVHGALCLCFQKLGQAQDAQIEFLQFVSLQKAREVEAAKSKLLK